MRELTTNELNHVAGGSLGTVVKTFTAVSSVLTLGRKAGEGQQDFLVVTPPQPPPPVKK
jgi:bacteriocin-like protein